MLSIRFAVQQPSWLKQGCNSVLTSCGRGFEWRRAVQLLRTMQTLREPRHISYIASLGENPHLALGAGRPDLVSFNTALSAVANS